MNDQNQTKIIWEDLSKLLAINSCVVGQKAQHEH